MKRKPRGLLGRRAETVMVFNSCCGVYLNALQCPRWWITERTRAIVPDWVVPRVSSARFCGMTRVIIICIAVKQLAKTVIKLGRPTMFNNQRIDISNTLPKGTYCSHLPSFEVRNSVDQLTLWIVQTARSLSKRRQTLVNDYFMWRYSLVPHGSNAAFETLHWGALLGDVDCTMKWAIH